MKKVLFPAIFLLLRALPAMAGESVIKDLQGMNCHVYTPDNIAAGTTYQLVVGVHGAGGNGKGACGLAGWANRGDVIVIGPSFVSRGSAYQNGNGVHAEKLIALAETLGKTHKLKDKMFIHGFSGGAQFAHRFAMLHPDHVCGVSAHSGGSWATGGRFSESAKKMYFAISCGEKDTGKAWREAPLNRLEWFGQFRDILHQGRFTYIAATWPGVGHSRPPGVMDLAKQCFQLSTGLPGENATTPVAISGQWQNLGNAREVSAAPPKPSGLPIADAVTLDKIARAAFAKADAETIPREQLVTFMKKYPPAVWKEKPGAAKLLQQCEGAAKEWLAAAKAKGMWSEQNKQEFLRFSKGIDIETEG